MNEKERAGSAIRRSSESAGRTRPDTGSSQRTGEERERRQRPAAEKQGSARRMPESARRSPESARRGSESTRRTPEGGSRTPEYARRAPENARRGSESIRRNPEGGSRNPEYARRAPERRNPQPGRASAGRQPRIPEKPGSAVIFTALKLICLGALAFFLYRQMSGSRESTVSFADMQSAVTAAVDLNTMQEADNQMIKRLYGLDPADYDGMCLYYPLTNMGAEELFLVKLKDVSQQAETEAAIDARLATQKKSFEGYGIEQSAMLARSISEVRGNYAIFVSAEDAAPIKNAFDRTY